MARPSLVGFEGLGQIALGHEHVADLLYRRRRGLAAIQRCRGLPLRGGLQWRGCRWNDLRASGRLPWAIEHAAELIVGDGEVTLPAGVAG